MSKFKIKEIKVNELFDLFNHTIPIHYDHKISIIYAPNGHGKSTILKMLYYIFTRNLTQLSKITFKSIDIEFITGERLSIKRRLLIENAEVVHSSILEEINLRQQQQIQLNISLNNDSKKHFIYGVTPESNSSTYYAMQYIERYLPFLHYREFNQWYDEKREEIINIFDIIENYYDIIPMQYISEIRNLANSIMPEWFQKIINYVKIKLIEAQRLYIRQHDMYDKSKPIRLRVEQASLEIKNAINKIREQVDELTQERERTFPFRLMQVVKQKEAISDIELKKKLDELSDTRNNLIKTGILDPPKTDEDLSEQIKKMKIDDTNRYVLSLYIQDVQEKFSYYNDLYTKINLFKSIIEEQFDNKSLTIDRDVGFVINVFSPKNPKLKKTIDTTKLSSGEQHLIVLFYELIFNTKEKSLILIDEPEISLHVAWQMDFFDNLYKVAELHDLHFLIATHSPQIINDKWHCTIDLSS